MWIRNYKGDIVFINVSKYTNEKELYSTLWKIKFNKNIENKTDNNAEIVKLIIY
jgi:hypothetical protein